MEILKRIFAIALFVVSVFGVALKAQPAKKVLPLEPKKTIEQEISAGQTHTYEIKAAQNQFLHIIFDQKSVDVVATLYSLDGKKLLEVDNPNIRRGPEQIFLITPNAGIYRIEIKAKETGRYDADLEALRPAALPADQKRIDAERLFIEGEKLSANAAQAPALVKYEEALQLINGSNDAYGEATILYSLGKTSKALGNTEKSTEYFSKSLTLFQTAGSWDEIFKNLSPLYMFMGSKQKTFDYLAGAIPLVQALKNQRLEAILLTALAKVCRDLNQPDKSLDYSNQALALFRITGKRGAEVFTLTEIADGDLSLEDKKRAVDYLNQAILLSQGASDKSLEVTLLMGIAYIYASIDEHQQSLDYLQKTLPLWREIKDKNGEAYSLNFIGSTYSRLGNYTLGRDYLEQSLALIRQTSDLRAQAYTISQLGDVEFSLGDTGKAFDYYQKALKIFQDTGEKHGEASALSSLAQIYWMKGDKPKSMENYERSLSIWRTANFREGEASALNNLGFIYEYGGEADKALNNHNQALPIFRLLGNRSGEASALYGVARVMYLRGNLDESLANTEAAINIIESIRTKISGTDLRTSFLATYQPLYKFYVDLLMQIDKRSPAQGFDARALQASERARARGLLDILNEARADIRQGISPILLERERKLQQQLNAKDSERKRLRTPTQLEAIDKEIRQLTADYQLLQGEIKQTSPRYAALTQPQPVGLKEIQQMLDADTLLLEYSLGEVNSYVWIVSNSSIKTFMLPKRETIEDQARAFYQSVKIRDNDEKIKQSVSILSKTLLEPINAELGNKRLLIVPDGALSYVPFAALVNPRSKIPDPKSDVPLIVDHEIIYLPSASVLSALRTETTGRAPAPRTIAVIADPVFDASDTRLPQAVRGKAATSNLPLKAAQRDAGFNSSMPLPRLPKAYDEAMAILTLVSDAEKKSAMDFEANLTVAMSPEMSQYRMIHFVAHGLLDSQHPEFSGIVLSLVDEKGKSQDGFLRLHQIYNLKLPADLVVLSACETALGKEIKGEGLIGLTRGFMYAGSTRIVATLWLIADDGSQELMKQFYQSMLGEKKLRPAAALREAQINMWKSKRFNSPYFWAAFTLQGEWK